MYRDALPGESICLHWKRASARHGPRKNRSETAEKNGRLTITGKRNKSGLRVPYPFRELPSGNLDRSHPSRYRCIGFYGPAV